MRRAFACAVFFTTALTATVSSQDIPSPRPLAVRAKVPEATTDPVLSGPTSEPYLVELKVKNVSKGSAILWDVYVKDASGNYIVEGKAQIRIIKAEQALLLAGPPGAYLVKCRLIKGEDATELRWTGQLTGGGKPTPPGPNPDPKPLPDGRLGLIKVSRDAIAASAHDKKAQMAKAVADNNRSVASVVAAGGLPDPAAGDANAKAVLKERGELNTKSMQDLGLTTADLAAWVGPIDKALFALYTAEKLKTKQDWCDAFREIADGLAP